MSSPIVWTIEVRFSPAYGYEASVKEMPGCFAAGSNVGQLHEALAEAISQWGEPDAMQWGYREHPDEDPEVEAVSEKYARFRAQDEHLKLVQREVRYGPWTEVRRG